MKKTEFALNQFVQNVEKIEKMLSMIKNHVVENHLEKEPENVNWATVGTTAYVVEQLEEIVESLQIKENANEETRADKIKKLFTGTELNIISEALTGRGMMLSEKLNIKNDSGCNTEYIRKLKIHREETDRLWSLIN